MIIKPRTRGQPVLALVLIMAGWIGARGYAWERALDEAGDFKALSDLAAAPAPHSFKQSRSSAQAAAPHLDMRPAALDAAPYLAPPADPALLTPPPPVTITPPAVAPPVAPAPLAAMPAPPDVPPSEAMRRMRAAAGHQSLWMAATALMPLTLPGVRTAPTPPLTPAQTVPARRWSGDGWLLLRRNSAGLITPGPLPGTYGASQVGAVIRYRLDTTSRNKPSIYVRGAAALGAIHQQEAALGLSARPLGGVSVVAMAEARATRSGSSVQVRPAVALVTELPPQRLPLGFAAEAYAQGGYIGGHAPTAFIDGLVRIERPVAGAGGWSLKAGGGAWAAGQRGASRVDVGPVASVTVRLTDTASARVEADWRFRVRGRAKPDSGPALTISAGF